VEDAAVLRAADAARLLSDAAGTRYELVGRLHGGESGAYEFRGPEGRPVVVKWDANPGSRQLRGEAVVLSERLRTQAAWPVPAQSVLDVNDVRFVIQEFMPGVPCERLDHRLLDQLLELHERRRGLARPGDPVHWPAALLATLTVGGDGYCLHAPLRDFDRRTRSLVERIEAFGYSINPDELRPRARDIVHWDLHAGNLLVSDGSLTAVIDTDFAVVGDAQFDLVTLAVTSLAVAAERDVRERLFAAAGDLGSRPAQAYLAHLILRVIDWPIRRGRPGEVERWLRAARELLLF
jgi:Phosphotransferase enzyme family